MASYPVDPDSEPTDSASSSIVASVYAAPHPTLTTLARINELANYLFHPNNTSFGFNLHHHIVNNLVNGLCNALEYAVASMQAQTAVTVRAQNPEPVAYGTGTGTTGAASVATTAVEGYQLPRTFAHETSHMGGWMDGQ